MLDAIPEHVGRPMAGGALYVLVYLLLAQSTWGIRQWLGTRSGPIAVRLFRGESLYFWGLVAGSILAVGYLLVLSLDGTFAARDVGWRLNGDPIDWPWALALAGGLGLWLGVLWSARWPRRDPALASALSSAEEAQWLYLPLRVIRAEAGLAIMRAALIPLLGGYWGVWAALGVKALVERANPAIRWKTELAGRRPFVMVELALDWISTTLLVISGSLWMGLIGRAAGYLVITGLAHLASLASTTQPAPSATSGADEAGISQAVG